MARVSWCFTSFKAIDHQLVDDKKEVNYCVFQKEKCPKTGKEHWQGYIEFVKKRRMGAVKEFFNDNGLHLERRKGDRDEARAYCMKEESRIEGPWEFGDFKSNGQGRRSDLKRCVDELLNGEELSGLLLKYPETYVRYHRGLKAARFELQLRNQSINRQVITTVHWGPTGTGKTYGVYESHPVSDIYPLTLGGSSVWFDGYNGQPVLLIDDFYGNRLQKGIPEEFLLRMLDRYPLSLQTKGGFTTAAWTRVYITSNIHPKYWYPINYEGHLKPELRRRLTHIYEYKEDKSRVEEENPFAEQKEEAVTVSNDTV